MLWLDKLKCRLGWHDWDKFSGFYEERPHPDVKLRLKLSLIMVSPAKPYQPKSILQLLKRLKILKLKLKK